MPKEKTMMIDKNLARYLAAQPPHPAFGQFLLQGGEGHVLGCPRSPTLRWDLTSLLLEYLEKAYLPLEAGVA